MKRFLADAVLIFVLITIGNYVKEQEHTQSSVTIEQKVSDFEDDIAQKHTIKQQVETGSLNEIKENKASALAKSTSEFVVDAIHSSVTAVSNIFDSIFA
ncbi:MULTISPECIES: hypothetical protein [Bacillota]|jgi:actin-like ATPase involved in cell morphogenesis|uniref:Uncharacterized protein n=2 Tax=Amedibacillus TaxID=2749846 RepID=A0A7G9GLP9_9FIRM|nr:MULTISPECIES: hypothetical protein [Bacillota]QNM11731.1 hypothetical protein H9Q80_15995 [[Eubacterium] hominis]MCH4285019.1 hypothetical protein [Amedibacillus hominis]RGB56052.1 hypothetical protein DW271_07530 [Absiella sp. AM22-9]RGB61813.1 hypothetical protein DW120_05575 [Absiella sp. AM10-20]RGB70366.1 hypothetical protein DW113_01140 [Absiella sp. AM09-45]